MKKQIRSGVFETNSSSVHNLTVTDGDTFAKWERGEFLYDWDTDKLVSKEEVVEQIKNSGYEYPEEWWKDVDKAKEIFEHNYYLTWDGYDKYIELRNYGYFEEHYQMPSGEIAIAFGYTGYDD